jgi:hypothetical protein
MSVYKKLHVDVEAGSPLELGDRGKTGVGVHRYAADRRTKLWLLAHAINFEPVKLWFPGDPIPPEFFDADEFIAHNAAFERAIFRHKLTPLYGFPDIPLKKWRCNGARFDDGATGKARTALRGAEL